MTLTRTLKIPNEHLAGFQEIVRLEPRETSAIESALKDTTVVSLDQEEIIDSVRQNLSSDVSVSDQSLRDMLSVLISLNVVRGANNLPTSNLAADVVASLRTEQRVTFEPYEGDWGKVADKLNALLAAGDSIELIAKVFDIITEYRNVYCAPETRIVTDIRPIFTDDVSKGPAAAAIIHNLKICYRRNGERDEFYVAIDEDELNHLREVLDRAEAKADLLREAIGLTKMRYVNARKNDE